MKRNVNLTAKFLSASITLFIVMCHFSAMGSTLLPSPLSGKSNCASLLSVWNNYYSSNLKLKFGEAFQAWRLEREGIMNQAMGSGLVPKKGLKIKVNNKYYSAVLFLGRGHEGSVFLINDNGTLKAAKIFDDATRMSSNLESIEIKSRTIRLPTLLETDRAGLTVILEYVQGVPLDYILEHVDLSSEDRHHFLVSAPAAYGLEKQFLHNVVIVIESGELVLLDPF